MAPQQRKEPSPLSLQDFGEAAPDLLSLWRDRKESRVFVTGGTGFVGRWLMHAFSAANREVGSKSSAVVLTRNASRLKRTNPELANDPAISILEGDVRSFPFPSTPFTHIVHAATPASAKLNDESPLEMMEIIVDGTRRIVELARRQEKVRILHMSSGAIYGSAPPESPLLSEDWRGGPDCLDLRHMYAESRRMAEMILAAGAVKSEYEWVVARGFAFVGPGLPLDAHFAIGNFIADVLHDRPIRVNGSGSPRRSYLYASDMAVWLWSVLFRGQTGNAYNVGSEAAISIRELAELVGEIVAPMLGKKSPPVEIANNTADVRHDFYVPSTQKARALGLRETVALRAAILKTAAFHLPKKS